MIYTREFIKEKITTNDTWLYHGITAIHRYQTEDEQISKTTKEDNGVGFNGVDAEILSSFAEQLRVRNFLTPKQKEIARKKMIKYTGQLTRIANKEI